MYKKIRDAFFSEFLKDGLSDLPETFYRDSRNYLETITDDKIKFVITSYSIHYTKLYERKSGSTGS